MDYLAVVLRKDIAVPKTPTKFSISGIGGLVQAQFIFIPIQKLGGNENDNMRLPSTREEEEKKCCQMIGNETLVGRPSIVHVRQ